MASLLEILAARHLGVDVDASDQEVKSAFRAAASNWHPDISDEDNAQELYMAADRARQILLGNFNPANRDQVETIEDILFAVFSEDEIDTARDEADAGSSYSSAASKRADPTGFDQADFEGMDPDERRYLVTRLALGIETLIVWQGTEGLYKTEYMKEDFFRDVNKYIGDRELSEFKLQHYYRATQGGIRDGVGEDLYVDTVHKVEHNLQQEYGDGTTIREVGKIVAYFMMEGSMRLGDLDRFVGDMRYGRDSRFGRGDDRFGDGPFSSGSDTRYGRDNRFGR